MMMKAAAEINWAYPGDAIPAFITLLIMPMTYSIAYGLIAGIITYILLNTIAWLVELVSGGRIVPASKELKDPWTWKLPGGFFPPWLTRVARGKKDFWREDERIDGTEERATPDEKRFGTEEVATSVEEDDGKKAT
jgi:AGZA family xanthine/uracil permease-like MFS transporter